MQNLIVLAFAYVGAILLSYLKTMGQVSLTLIAFSVLLIPLAKTKAAPLKYVLAGMVLGFTVAFLYNGSNISTGIINYNNKNYVKIIFEKKYGLTSLFSSGNRLIAMDKCSLPDVPVKGEEFLSPALIQSERYATDGIVFRINPGSRLLGLNDNTIRSRMEIQKMEINEKIKSVIGREEGALCSSLVLGVKDDTLSGKVNSLKGLGIIHILSISGFHVNLLEKILKKLKVRKLATGIIIVYSIIVDSVPAYRASIMKLSASFAHWNRKDDSPLGNLIISAMILLAGKPYLMFDLSFQLTYLSTLGMILLSEPIAWRLAEIRLLGKRVKQAVSTSTAALFLTLPYLARLSNVINMSIFPANLLIVPFYTIFCVLSFPVVLMADFKPGLLLLKPVLHLLYSITGVLEGAVGLLFNLNIDLYSLNIIYYLFIAGLLIKHFHALSLIRKTVFALTVFFAIFFIMHPPLVTRIIYTRSFGMSSIEVVSFMERRVLVTGKMYKPGIRNNVLKIEKPTAVGGLGLSAGKGDFVDIEFFGRNLSNEVNRDKSDIINQEYVIVGSKIFKIR